MTDRVPPVTAEQSHTIARTLYEPTIRRMNILCTSLIQTTNNGDFALWAPLSVLEQMLQDLKWNDATAPERFLALVSLTLRRYAEKCEVYTMALIAAHNAGAPAPPFQLWNDEDTIAVYDEIDAKYPRNTAPEPEAPMEVPPAAGSADPGAES